MKEKEQTLVGSESEWSDMSTHGLLFQWASTIDIQLSAVVLNKADIIIISSLKIYFYPP
jgi:hypothetical protein